MGIAADREQIIGIVAFSKATMPIIHRFGPRLRNTGYGSNNKANAARASWTKG